MDASGQALIAVVGAVVAAALGALAQAVAARLTAKPASKTADAAVQTAINDGFAKLMAERERLDEVLRSEMEDLRGEVRNLTQHVISLESLLRDNGLEAVIPPRPVKGEIQPLIVLEGGKKEA